MLIMLSWSIVSRDVPAHFGLWLGGGWLAAFLSAKLHRARFRCPYCWGFFSAGIAGCRENERCAHCELPRGFTPQGTDLDGYTNARGMQ